jgi:hippurate hydrolase
MHLIEPILADAAQIAAIRRDIHAHPELRFEEFRTADLVAAKLAEWGIPIHRGLGGTGVVGIIQGKKPGTGAIGLRADMDALPIQEINAFGHASKHAGKMHACGHDGHTAALLAAGKHLARERDFAGTVYLIFQPAEEGGAGARRMIEDGIFTLFPMDAVFGLHNWPGMKVGQFGMTPGPMMASSNEFTITIHGKGAHAAMPHNGVDPVMVAVNLAQALQTIVTRNKKPIDTAVLSITQIHAGDVDNVIPDSAMLNGTVRTFSLEVLDLIERRMGELAHGIAAAFGATTDIKFHRNYPPTVNSAAEAAFCASVAAGIVGDENVFAQIEPTMGAEDFSFFLQAKPGCYVFAGNGEGGHRQAGHGMGPCMLHNPSYDFNDDLLPLAATYWVRLAQTWFEQH